MKKIFLISAIVLGINSFAQQAELVIPEQATEDFEQRFNHHGGSENIVWSTIESGYKVSYDFNDRHGEVIYNQTGLFKESRVSMQADQLEQGVKDYLSTNYANATILHCYRLNSNTAPERNLVIIEESGTQIEVHFRPDGKFHYQK